MESNKYITELIVLFNKLIETEDYKTAESIKKGIIRLDNENQLPKGVVVDGLVNPTFGNSNT